MMPSPHRHLSVDELSQRASTGLAIRRGEIKISDPIPSSYVHNGVEMDGAHEQPPSRLEGTRDRRSAGTLPGRNGSTAQPVHISRFTERTSLGPSLATSNMSSTGSKDSPIQRKNAGLRASIKRVFGSKKDKNPISQRGSQYQNESRTVLSMGSPPQRIQYQASPLQHSGTSHSRALHSNAPSPHIRAESEALVQHQPSTSQLGKRRNTVPDLLLVPPVEPTQLQHKDPAVQTMEKSISLRHATATRRGTPPPMQFRRRSRSADALAGLLRSSTAKSPHRRDRSEEIAYWRKSIIHDPVPSIPIIVPSISREPVKAGNKSNIALSHRPRPSLEPVQDFDFGLGSGTGTNHPITLQERVNTLEVKLFDFEYALARMQGTDIVKPNLPKKLSKRKPLQDLFPESRDSSAQESSNDLSYVSSPSDHWQPSTPREHFRPDRTSKATTVKPEHHRDSSERSQSSSSPSSVRFTREQYDALRTLIQDEKSARQQLEMQIMNLRKEVDILKTPVYAYVRPAKYPTPSPESFHDQVVLSTPRLLRRSPPLWSEHDHNETSRFSMTETDPEADTDDPVSPEVYETPKENTFRFEPRTTMALAVI